MKKFFRFSFLFFSTFLAGNSYGHFTEKGHVHIHSETKQVFLNPNCQSTGTCDLKRFTLTTSVYEVWFSDDPKYPTYGNGVTMEYETDSVGTLEKYAIVQFIKGCVFHSSRSGEGKLTRNLSYVVPSFGESIPLCFPDWVIDSQDTDPAYNSDPEHGRFYLLRWNKPGSYELRTQKYYGMEKPKVPVVYMTDHPAGAFVTGSGVKNAALQFKTCIYKARDVPAATRRNNVNFASPLTCFEWENIYVYDFSSASFQTVLADVTGPEEPPLRVEVYLLALFITLFIAFALVMFSQFGKLLHQADRQYPKARWRYRRMDATGVVAPDRFLPDHNT